MSTIEIFGQVVELANIAAAIKKWLETSNAKITPPNAPLPTDGDSYFGGGLDLSGLTSIPDGFNPTVGGGLDLPGLTSIPDGFNPTVGGGLYLSGLTSIPDGFNPTVGGDLYLRGLTSIPDGFNPTVGGGLDLRGLTSIPDGFNPTVGGDLDLRGLTSIPDGFNPTVGGNLYLSGLTTNHTPLNGAILIWQNGKYISADGMFTQVVKKRGNVYHVRKIGREKITYLVTNGQIHAHGDTLAKAKVDLQFKANQQKLKTEPITADTLINIPRYRSITGACEQGCNDFIEANFAEKEAKLLRGKGLAASKIIETLKEKNAYGLQSFLKALQNG